MCVGVVAPCIEKVFQNTVLHVFQYDMFGGAGFNVLFNLLVDDGLVGIVGPGHHIFIESHCHDADEKGDCENRSRQTQKALSRGPHDNEFTGSGKPGEAHERTQQD